MQDSTGEPTEIRPFRKEDVEPVWRLMRDLAVFEGYIDDFRVTPADLLAHGFGPSPAFGVFVAVRGETIAGIAVHYTIPWTFDLRPVLVLKEFYVADALRGLGIGAALFDHLKRHASSIGATQLRWAVLPGNEAAMRFYRAQGGQQDTAWEYWTLPLSARNDSANPAMPGQSTNNGRSP